MSRRGQAASRNVDLRFRDSALSIEDRIELLLGQMTLAEKAGLMFHSMVLAGREGVPVPPRRSHRVLRALTVCRPGGGLTPGNVLLNLPNLETMLERRHMTHFNIVGPIPDAGRFAQWQNRVQERARRTRLGIPVTFSTDPRHHFTENLGTSAGAAAFSEWPETLGLAALRDPEVTARFADIARQEYLATGLRVALHPQIDLATEPRWARASGTFGEDAELTADLAVAYIRGFQTDTLGASSVATMAKHFPGGGPQKDGEDPHFAYGREQVYPGGMFEHHLKPFERVIAAGAAQMMPYYGMPEGTELEEVGFAFNKAVITGMLRERFGFDGIVCADWGVLNDTRLLGEDAPARAWGVEHLTPTDRAEKAIGAGIDQFGGEATPGLIVELVNSGRVSGERLDESARRLLREKFRLGLFDGADVDPARAASIVGRADFRAAGRIAQRASMTLLKNENAGTDGGAALLPLTPGVRIYAEGVNAVPPHSVRVDSPDGADVALLRLRAPFEPRPGGFESQFHAGSLAFDDIERDRIIAITRRLPTVIELYLDRPAVFPEIAEAATAVLVDFGAREDAIWDVLFGVAAPEGRLPFDLPRSMNAVEASRPDVPFDTMDPVYRFGDGIRYPSFSN